MAEFPKLKTQAVTQYPSVRSVRYRTEALRFLDGTEQRYRNGAGPRRRWDVCLSQIDEGEMAALELFFEENRGAAGNFAFTDPWDGRLYENCSLEADGLESISFDEMRCATSMTIVANRE